MEPSASLRFVKFRLYFDTKPCMAATSERAATPTNVTFVGVAARSDVAAMQGFVSKYNLNFTNLNDADGSIWARYNVPWQTAYVFYRADGSSTFVNNPTAAMPTQELSDRVAALS